MKQGNKKNTAVIILVVAILAAIIALIAIKLKNKTKPQSPEDTIKSLTASGGTTLKPDQKIIKTLTAEQKKENKTSTNLNIIQSLTATK